MRSFSKRFIAAVLVGLLVCGVAWGADWPAGKPVTILCGYSAGGSSDIMCRYVASSLSKYLGVPVVVENLPGSNSWLAWNRLLKRTPTDGYTLALINMSAMLGHYDENNPREETIDSFDLLASMAIDYQVLAIRQNETRFHDYPSFLEYAKDNPIIIAASSVGITSGDGSVGKYLEKYHGSKIITVPTDGAGDAETMFLAGETDVLSGNVGDMSGAEDNGFKVIVCFSGERSDFLPDVPTEKELGLGDFEAYSLRGFTYMPGVDPAIKETMRDALAKVAQDPEFKQRMDAMLCQIEFLTGKDYEEAMDKALTSRLSLWEVSK